MALCKTLRPVMIDALRMCYDVVEDYHIEELKKLEIEETYEWFPEFHLRRIDGKYFDYVYEIRYWDDNELKTISTLKLSMRNGTKEKLDSGKVWVWVENWVFYDRMAFHCLPFITDSLGLEFHNITSLDLCLDLPFNMPRKLRRLLKSEINTTILNGKRVKDRNIDRPEISYITSGSLNQTDKYLTVNIKQKKAIKDKTQGTTLSTYDKIAEIRNSSGKEYIQQIYGNPKKLYRLEIHLNNADIKEYFGKCGISVECGMIFDQKLLTWLFIDHLNNLVRFETPEEKIRWEDLLGGYITTLPVSEYMNTVKC